MAVRFERCFRQGGTLNEYVLTGASGRDLGVPAAGVGTARGTALGIRHADCCGAVLNGADPLSLARGVETNLAYVSSASLSRRKSRVRMPSEMPPKFEPEIGVRPRGIGTLHWRRYSQSQLATSLRQRLEYCNQLDCRRHSAGIEAATGRALYRRRLSKTGVYGSGICKVPHRQKSRYFNGLLVSYLWKQCWRCDEQMAKEQQREDRDNIDGDTIRA